MACNSIMPDVVLIAITGQIGKVTGFGEATLADWRAANLLKPSAIKPLIATIEQGLILRVLGTLQPQDQFRLRSVLEAILG